MQRAPLLLLSTLAACMATADPDAAPRSDAGVVAAPDAGLEPDAGRAEIDAGPNVRPDAGTPPLDLTGQLEALGFEVTSRAEVGGSLTLFELSFTQPEDHAAPAGRTFAHRLVLKHVDSARPLVVHTTGYTLFGGAEVWRDRGSEPASLLEANELIVEHRFFGGSIASGPNWRHLTIAQSAADTHALVEALRTLYSGPFVATGVSKGGMTALFHAFFFPEDYDLVMPYVAPISFGLADPRYLAHLDGVGPRDGACRRLVRDLARIIVERRAEIALELQATDSRLLDFDVEVIEAGVAQRGLGFEWAFWQYWGTEAACAALPGLEAPVSQLALFANVAAEDLQGGGGLELRPYQYQVLAELGGPAYYRADMRELAAGIDWSVLPPAAPNPWPQAPTFDPGPMRDVDAWLRESASDVLGVYGAWDPWSGGMPTVMESEHAALFVVPGVGHGAQLALLPEEVRAEAYRRIEAHLGVPVNEGAGLVGSPVVTHHQRVVELLGAFERAGRPVR